MSSPPLSPGNERPATDPYSPSNFEYSLTYPTSNYPATDAPSEEPQVDGKTRARPSTKLLGVALAVLLFAVLAGLSWAGWPSRGGPDIAVQPAAPAVPGPSADQLAGEAVIGWLRGGGQLIIDDLAADYHRVAAATQTNNLPELELACTALRTSAERGQADPPIPDFEAQVHWSASLAQSARSGTDCLAALTANHLELVTQAGHEAGVSSRESALMNARIAALGGK